MKKIFTVFMLVTLIFTVGCGNKEQDAAKDTQPKVEQKTKEPKDVNNTKIEQKDNTPKNSGIVSKAEINRFANEWLEEVTAMNYRLTDLEKNAGKNGISKDDIERIVPAYRKELDKMNNIVVDSLMKFKENGVSKADFNKFVAERLDALDSLGVSIATVETKSRIR